VRFNKQVICYTDLFGVRHCKQLADTELFKLNNDHNQLYGRTGIS